MNEQGTQVAPLLFNQLNPGGGEIITNYDFFIEATWDNDIDESLSSVGVHFLLDLDNVVPASYSAPGTSRDCTIYRLEIFSTDYAGSLYYTSNVNLVPIATQLLPDYLWDSPSIKGYCKWTTVNYASAVSASQIFRGVPLLIHVRFCTAFGAPIVKGVSSIAISWGPGAANKKFSNPDTAKMVRPDTLTFLTYDEFMEKLKAAWANPLI